MGHADYYIGCFVGALSTLAMVVLYSRLRLAVRQDETPLFISDADYTRALDVCKKYGVRFTPTELETLSALRASVYERD